MHGLLEQERAPLCQGNEILAASVLAREVVPVAIAEGHLLFCLAIHFSLLFAEDATMHKDSH